MYETEVNHRIVSGEEIPKNIEQQFGGLSKLVLARTVLPWSEHCTECVWPTCYKTCDLYSPREDGRCRRFVDGMVRVECPPALNSYLLRIQFKQWAKLWAPANIRLYPTKHAGKIERNDYNVGNLLQHLPAPAMLKAIATKKRYGFKKRKATQRTVGGELPTSFLLECYNPTAQEVKLSLTMRPMGLRSNFPFQRLFNLAPGFSRIRIPVNDITKLIHLHAPFEIELVPNDVENLTTLYFGVMDFVRELAEKPSKCTTVKCVVWDLDNTLWSGVLVEDGIGKIELKAGIIDVIRAFDERGILQSVSSKNDYDHAMQALKRFRIDDYFLYPQISWQPKSTGVGAIAKHLNISTDSILFIDDSQFERDQVTAVHPLLRAVDALDYRELLQMDECRGAVTAESKLRRTLYQTEAAREDAIEGFGSDYIAFLRDAKINVSILPMTEDNFERVHELTQRTNQMNFSGNRYNRDVLRSIAANPLLETYVLRCEDRFGSYGIIGFCIIDSREPLMTDLMFSCRVQSKRVEHAFLSHILRKYISRPTDSLFITCRKTSRNAASIKVFTDFDMEEVETVDGVTLMVFRGNKEIPDDGVITVVETLVGSTKL
jgi:FkbH-like protein